MNIIHTLLLAILVFAISPPAAATEQNLPDIGDPSGGVISPEVERRLGQAVMREVRRYATMVDDPEVESYIQSIGYQLVANSDDNRLPFVFFVIQDPAINAFAAPGGVVGINSGVIINAQSESELAGVLAHEISHVTQRHMARTYEAASKLSAPTAAALLGAVLLAIVNPAAAQAALTIIGGASTQYQINFTRSNEEEADRVGMQLLARSGFDPEGMPSFFERLLDASRYRGAAPEYLQTHPLTTNRVADSKARAAQYETQHHKDSITFKLVRAKLTAVSFQDPGEAIMFFEEKLQGSGYPDMESARYGYVIALTRANHFEQAAIQLEYLLSQSPENSAYLIAAAKLASAQRNFQRAVAIYEKTDKLYPNYRPVVLGLTRAYLDAGNAAAAREVLRGSNREYANDLLYYDLLSQAEASAGSPVEAGIAKAEYYYIIGDTQLAIERLKYAQHQYSPDYYQAERIEARLTQLEYELSIEKELKL
ncbi:MAG TPA: M48 family metalloprotease [Gammaproteobacteria bacterium]